MGYNISENMVHTYHDVLEVIVLAIENGEVATFDCEREHLAAERFRLREAMKSAEAYPTLYDGRYAGLSENTRVHVKSAIGQLHVVSTGKLTHRLSPPDERKALKNLDQVQSNLHVLEFFPSPRFSEDYFARAVEKRGWRLFINAKVKDGGKISYPVERLTPSAGPDGESEGDRGFGAVL